MSLAIDQLPRSTPAAQGIAPAAVEAFVHHANREITHLHSFMLLRHGSVVAEGWWEPYAPHLPHVLYSLSKSFTSTAIGMLVAEGRLSVDDHVLDFFPDEAPADPGEYLRALRVRHLLSMSTGHDADTVSAVFSQQETTWTQAFLQQPLIHQPGTHFVYNTPATYMLSAIAQRLTGMRLLHYLQPRLFEPLGIANPAWETSPQGIDVGGAGLSVTTEAIARFGQLYLQKGAWQGRQLLPAAWVEAATARQVDNGTDPKPDWAQGYGYQFWRCRHGAYRGDGAFGQFCVVMPAQDAVLAITAGTGPMQPILDLVWQHLLPAMTPAALPDDAAAQGRLTALLGQLRLPPVEGEKTSPLAAEVADRPFAMAPNGDGVSTLSFHFTPDGSVLTLTTQEGEQLVSCGHGVWARGEASLSGMPARQLAAALWHRVAASGAWTDPSTYTIQLWWYETPYGLTLACHFDGSRLVVEQNLNVSFGPTARPALEGRLV